MTAEETRKRKEALYVLQEQLLRNLMYDALKTEEKDPLNFFKICRGSLMDGVVVDWWKIFGNHSASSHWKKLLPEEEHKKCREDMDRALGEHEPARTLNQVWCEVRKYRNTIAAHHDFDEEKRA